MIEQFNTTEWRIGPYELKLTTQDGVVQLNHQTPDRTLLTTLAIAGFEDASACALDLIFNECQGVDDYDAYGAYSYLPLSNPPAKYKSVFRSVDWTSDSQTRCRYAIILAGASAKEDRELLLRILRTLNGDFRVAALFAASSFLERQFVEVVASIALNTKENEASATGELRAFVFCFRRWLNEKVLNMEELKEMFILLETSQRCSMPWKRLINYIVSQQWAHVPYPEERTA